VKINIIYPLKGNYYTFSNMSSPLGSYYYPSVLMEREKQGGVFWKKMKKPNRLTLDPKNAE
jgi:hypothetical protein